MNLQPAHYRNLLPASPPEIAAFANNPDWHRLSDERQAWAIRTFQAFRGQHVLEEAMRFADAIKPILDMMRSVFGAEMKQ